MKDSGCRFDEINTMANCFDKTGELNGSNYVKLPLRSIAIFKTEKNDK